MSTSPGRAGQLASDHACRPGPGRARLAAAPASFACEEPRRVSAPAPMRPPSTRKRRSSSVPPAARSGVPTGSGHLDTPSTSLQAKCRRKPLRRPGSVETSQRSMQQRGCRARELARNGTQDTILNAGRPGRAVAGAAREDAPLQCGEASCGARRERSGIESYDS